MIFIVGMSANQCGGTAKCVVRFMRKENQERNYSTQTPFGAQNKSASANRLSLRTDNKRPYALCYNGFGYRARTRFIPFASFGYLNFSSVFFPFAAILSYSSVITDNTQIIFRHSLSEWDSVEQLSAVMRFVSHCQC